MAPHLSLGEYHGVQRMNQLCEGKYSLFTWPCGTWKIELDKVFIWGGKKTLFLKFLR